MKTLILIIASIAFVGCSSSNKNTAEDAAYAHQQDVSDATQSVTEKAKSEIENAAEDLKNAAEDLKSAATDTASQATNAVSSTTSSFGEYTGTEVSKVTCTAGTDVRVITVLNGDNGGCGVVYNKFGNTKTVAVARSESGYCNQVQEKIKGNLTAPGFFTCQ